MVRFSLVLDLQQKLNEKGPAYERWASVFNLKQMANVMLFLNENNVESIGDLLSQADTCYQRCDELQAKVRQCDDRLSEISMLKKNTIDYSKTRDVYIAYRKAGYSKKFFEAHRQEILTHKAAKQAFDTLEQIPKVKDLNREYSELLSERSRLKSELFNMRQKAKEYELAKENLRMFFEQDTAREDVIRREKER